MTSDGPASTEPTGAHSPLERQHITVVTVAAYWAAVVPVATSACQRRAPSMCTATPDCDAKAETCRSSARGQGAPLAGMWVFSTHNRVTRGVVVADRIEGPSQIGGVDGAVVIGYQVELHAGVAAGGAPFVGHDVLAGTGHHQIAGSGEQAEGKLVGHRPRRNEDRRVLAHASRERILQGVDRRIFAVDVVADRSVGHRLSHRRRRLRHGVGSQIDHAGQSYAPGAVELAGWPPTPFWIHSLTWRWSPPTAPRRSCRNGLGRSGPTSRPSPPRPTW